MNSEKMVSEKTPALFMSKTPFDNDNQKEKLCSRSTLSWILTAALLSLLIIVSILFLYPPYEQRMLFREEQPIEVKIVNSRDEDFIYEKKHPVTSNEKMENSKTTGNNTNPWEFEFLINPVDLCATIHAPLSAEYQNDPEVKLLILVPSAVNHFEERTAIRNTWGSIAMKPLGPLRLGFVVGTTTNKEIDKLIHKESLDFKDIIQVDIVDSNQQLTTKSVLMLKWVASMCPHAQYFLKVDDDTFVNVAIISNILNKEPYISEDKFIGGYIDPLRLPDLVFDLPMDDYELEDFPPYTPVSYIMTVPTAIDLFGGTKEVEPFLFDDDAFLTGLVAKHVDVPLIHEPTFVIDHPPMPPSWNAYSTLATAHSVTPHTLEQIWDEMNKSIVNSMFYLETAVNATGKNRKKKSV